QARRMASFQPIDPTQPDGVTYGFGILRADSYYGHAGDIFGYNTQFLRDPKSDTTIVILAGLTLAPDGQLPVSPLIVTVIDQLARTARADSPAVTTSTS